MEIVLSVFPLEWGGIGSALLAGAIIGLERQLMGKAVGIRTSSLICLATYLFIAMSFAATVAVSSATIVSDPSRIIGQVVTGVGFLGAGVIIARKGVVLGVTSAAVIWVLASIGVVIGIGHYLLGITIALLTVAVLVGVDFLERSLKWLRKSVDEAFVGKERRRRKTDTPIKQDIDEKDNSDQP